MKCYGNTIKLFCKSPSVVIPWLLLLAVENVILVRLYQSFMEVVHNSDADGMAYPAFYFKDIQEICFLIFIFFLFISYEFMRKIREASMDEILRVRGAFGGVIRSNQLLVLGTAVVIHTLNISVYLWLGYQSLHTPGFYADEIIKMLFIDIFLLSLASASIGTLISKLANRFAGYAVMLGILFLILPNTADLLLDCQINFHIPVFALRDLIYLIPPDITAISDALYGMPLEAYRAAAMLFWILLALFVVGWGLLRDKKRIRMIYGIGMAAVIFITGYQVQDKGSVLLMADHPDSVIMEKAKYNMDEEGKKEKAAFTVSAYDMELSMKKELKAVVTMTIRAERTLPEYIFTLYHGYRIRDVVDDRGNDLSFHQEGDYVIVDNSSMAPVKTICFSYQGHSATFYANSKACFLPGLFPYYPQAGFREIYQDMVFVGGDAPEADYRIRGLGQKTVVSNLEEHNGVLEGRTDQVILLYGFYEEKDVDGVSCVAYPLQPDSYENTSYFLSEEMKTKVEKLYEFLGIQKEFTVRGKKVINIPGSMAFNSALGTYYEYKDYILINGYDMDPYDILDHNIKAEGKETMKEAFFFIRPTADTDASKLTLNKDEMWFEGYDQDEVSRFRDTIVLKMRKLGVQNVARKVVQYLNDTGNSVDGQTFLDSIR